MELNSSVIPHYTCKEIPINELKKEVSLNESYLKEKPTWYIVNDKLVYFKKRSDYRLFTEQFFTMFANEIIGLKSIDYQVANIRKIHSAGSIKEPVGSNGLISTNFQNKEKYNYYLLSELENPSISSLVSYGDYCLSNLLTFFDNTLDGKSFEECKDYLLKLFIADAFTLQIDRNHHNIGFKTPKIDGLEYTKRLRPEIISNTDEVILENGTYRLKNFTPTPVYDSERILGVDHRNVFLHKPNDVWMPIFPFTQNLLFKTQEQAKKYQKTYCADIDPNLLEFYLTYSFEVKDLIDRLANGDEYREILERFKQQNSQILLHPKTIEYFENILKERQNEFKKVLSL